MKKRKQTWTESLRSLRPRTLTSLPSSVVFNHNTFKYDINSVLHCFINLLSTSENAGPKLLDQYFGNKQHFTEVDHPSFLRVWLKRSYVELHVASQLSIILQQSPAELWALLEDDALAAGSTLQANVSSENLLQSVEMLRCLRIHASECFFPTRPQNCDADHNPKRLST